jgi:hypothetical protein
MHIYIPLSTGRKRQTRSPSSRWIGKPIIRDDAWVLD